MPATIIIQARKIDLSSDNNIKLLQMYQAALTELSIKLLSDKDGPKSKVAPEAPREEDCFWSNWVVSTVKMITNINLKTSTTELACLKIEVDPPAEHLLSNYLMFLNSLLRSEKLGSKDAEKDIIDSKFVIVRELLYRLVAIGVSRDLAQENDGELLLKALARFVELLHKSEILPNNGRFRQSGSNFEKRLSSEHAKWESKFKRMVIAIKKMHQHREVISETLTSLRSMRRAIKAHIIACLNPSKEKDDFAPDWIDSSLQEAEQMWLKRPDVANEASSQLMVIQVDLSQGGYDDHQARVLTQSFNHRLALGVTKVKIVTKQLGHLYSLLNYANLVYAVFCQFDLLISGESWGPILNGLINFTEVGRLLNDFSDECERILIIPEDLAVILDRPAGKGLIKYELVTNAGVKSLLASKAADLQLLDEPALHAEISQLLGATLSGLASLQAQLNSNYRFIDTEKLQCLGYVESSRMLATAVGSASLGRQLESQRLQIEHVQRENLQLRRAIDLFKTNPSIIKDDKSPPSLPNRAELPVKSCSKDMIEMFLKTLIKGDMTESLLATFVASGIDLKAPYQNNNAWNTYTPLHIAAKTGQRALCAWILNYNVPVNILTESSETPMDKAAKGGQLELVKYFKSLGGVSHHVDQCTLKLHELINSDDITSEDSSFTESYQRKFFDLIAEGADVNTPNTSNKGLRGELMVHTLFIKGNCQLLHQVIVSGGNLTATNDQHETPLRYLLRAGKNSSPVINFLRENYLEQLNPEDRQLITSSTSRPLTFLAGLAVAGQNNATVSTQLSVIKSQGRT